MRDAATRIGAIAGKEFKHLGRDPRMLAAVLLMPVIQLLLFAYAISFDVKDVPTLIIDQDRTPASQAYVLAYRGSEFFHVVGEVQSLEAVDEAFDRNTARIAVVIPSGYARTLAEGERAQVAVLIDGSEPNSAKISRAYALALNQLYGQELTFAWADTQGLDLSQLGMLEARLRTWYNPERKSSDFLIPGLMVVVIMIVTVQQTAVTLVRERDQGTQEQMVVSPLRRTELMVGKLLPWTLLAFVDVLAITAIGIRLFGVPLRGDVTVLIAGAALFIFSSLGLGLIISALAPTLDTASITALLISFLPAFLLSGFAYALDQIPVVLQWISYLFPARFMVTISRGVFLKGSGYEELWPELAALSLYALIALLIAARLHGRRA